jgi:hypothetical protein
MTRVEELDEQAARQLQNGKATESLRSVKALLILEETLQALAVSIVRTLYDEFQATIAIGKVSDAVSFAKQALALSEASFGPVSEEALRFKPRVKNPKQHRLSYALR